ncbi:MAG: hypothetical protein ROR55_19720 [Devosia sp.]
MSVAEATAPEDEKAVDLSMEAIQGDPAKVFDGSFDLEAMLKAVEKEAETVGCDVSTEAARKKIKSMAYRVAQTKSAIDNAGKAQNEDLRKEINAVDALRRRVREELDKLKDWVRAPVDRWEVQEEARLDSHRQVIADIEAAAHVPTTDTAADIQARMVKLKGMDLSPTEMNEFSKRAEACREATLGVLTDAYARTVTAEAERAELERMRQELAKRDEEARKERDAREAKEREEERQRKLQARKEREAEAQRQHDAEIEAMVKAAADKARREMEAKAEAERNHLIQLQRDAEEKRKADAQRVLEEEKKRAEDKAHRDAVMSAASLAIIENGKIGHSRAGLIVKAIDAGKIPHVSIKF